MTPVPRILNGEDDKIVTAPVLTLLPKKRFGGAGEFLPGERIAKKNPVIRTLPGNITTPGSPVSAYNPDIMITKGA
jgi:hypothetical protein